MPHVPWSGYSGVPSSSRLSYPRCVFSSWIVMWSPTVTQRPMVPRPYSLVCGSPLSSILNDYLPSRLGWPAGVDTHRVQTAPLNLTPSCFLPPAFPIWWPTASPVSTMLGGSLDPSLGPFSSQLFWGSVPGRRKSRAFTVTWEAWLPFQLFTPFFVPTRQPPWVQPVGPRAFTLVLMGTRGGLCPHQLPVPGIPPSSPHPVSSPAWLLSSHLPELQIASPFLGLPWPSHLGWWLLLGVSMVSCSDLDPWWHNWRCSSKARLGDYLSSAPGTVAGSQHVG